MKTKLLTLAIIIGISLISMSMSPNKEKFDQPVLITSAGQSADVKLVKLLAKKQKMQGETMLMATTNDLDGIKTLIIVPGFSSKGLGAAGISQEDEMGRTIKLIEKAKEMNIPIVMIHIGGTARRGGQSDDFCKIVAENCQAMIVVQQGNNDGYFTEIAKNNKTPLQEVASISDVAIPMRDLFN